ncbi:MAG: hypothetical protein OEW39_05970 [Deltaproteobacteria bacterium]|nr:hypothetical protein [Deltaproteobacteria bacterium]
MKKFTFLRAGSWILAGLVVAVMLAACKGKSESPPPPPPQTRVNSALGGYDLQGRVFDSPCQEIEPGVAWGRFTAAVQSTWATFVDANFQNAGCTYPIPYDSNPSNRKPVSFFWGTIVNTGNRTATWVGGTPPAGLAATVTASVLTVTNEYTGTSERVLAYVDDRGTPQILYTGDWAQSLMGLGPSYANNSVQSATLSGAFFPLAGSRMKSVCYLRFVGGPYMLGTTTLGYGYGIREEFEYSDSACTTQTSIINPPIFFTYSKLGDVSGGNERGWSDGMGGAGSAPAGMPATVAASLMQFQNYTAGALDVTGNFLVFVDDVSEPFVLYISDDQSGVHTDGYPKLMSPVPNYLD